jgi:hypothetical protein
MTFKIYELSLYTSDVTASDVSEKKNPPPVAHTSALQASDFESDENYFRGFLHRYSFPYFLTTFLDRFLHIRHADFNGEHLSYLNKTNWPLPLTFICTRTCLHSYLYTGKYVGNQVKLSNKRCCEPFMRKKENRFCKKMDGKPWFSGTKMGPVQRVYLADGTTAQLKFFLLYGTTEEHRRPTIADVYIPSSCQAISLNFSAIKKFCKTFRCIFTKHFVKNFSKKKKVGPPRPPT